MDKLAKYHEVWRPLATYASTGEEFRRLFFTCMNYCGTVGADSLAEADLDVGFVGRKRVTISIHKKSDAVSFCRDVQQGLTLEDGAKKYQRDFKRVLTWLTDRNSNDREAALSFLWAHGRDIVIDASADDDLYSQGIRQYGTVASPICKFILDRMDLYNESRKFIVDDEKAIPDESYNENLRREFLPLGLCKYCRNFMAVERSSKQFCSDLCRAQSAQARETQAQRAEYMREYRKHPKVKPKAARRKRPSA